MNFQLLNLLTKEHRTETMCSRLQSLIHLLFAFIPSKIHFFSLPIFKELNPMNHSHVIFSLFMATTVIVFITVCFIMSLFDTIAWYRMPRYPVEKDYYDSHALHDLGHTIIPYYCPIHDPNGQSLIILISFIFLLFRILFKRDGRFILQRTLHTVSAMFLLRSLTIVSTALPNPNPACKFSETHPKSFNDLLHTALSEFPPPSCGNLVFSGHTTLLTLLFLTEYRHKLYVMTQSKIINCILFVISVLKTLVGYLSVISCRSHYTVDVVLAIIITTLVYRLFDVSEGYVWFRKLEQRHCIQYNGVQYNGVHSEHTKQTEQQDNHMTMIQETNNYSVDVMSKVNETERKSIHSPINDDCVMTNSIELTSQERYQQDLP